MKALVRKLLPTGLWLHLRALKDKPRSTYYADVYGSGLSRNHPHFSDNRKLLLAGKIPADVARLVPLIPGQRILEIGAGEGILSLALARDGRQKVYSLDVTPVRHEAAKMLRDAWLAAGAVTEDQTHLVLGDVFEHLNLLRDIDTVVASRVIYYFHDRIDELFAEVGTSAKHVALVGNAERALWWRMGKRDSLGEFAYYATVEGMTELLRRHGYEITFTDSKRGKDPVVVGQRV